MLHGSPTRLRSIALFVLLLAGVLTPVAWPAPAAAASEPSVTIDGRGWGHGRGLSQWGALGYAVDHDWDWRQILGHYYSNTGERTLQGLEQFASVRLTAMDGADTIVVRDSGGLTTSATGAQEARAWRIQPIGTNQYQLWFGDGCVGPWTASALVIASEVKVSPPGGALFASDDRTQLASVCAPNGTRRWYQGELMAIRGEANANRTVNVTVMDQYLRGVVPRESPADWGTLGGGRGMNALRAQAVAARSYAAAESRTPYAKTCDTTSCQVYYGAFQQSGSGTIQVLQAANTDRAIADTANVVRTLGGAPARTEYSSSTGGWTAGGTFPAVQDLGDSYAGNRNHTWQVELRVAAIEATFPQIGRFSSVQVTQRNGLGAEGGRVTQVVIRGTAGAVTRTGMQFRSDFMAASNCTLATQSSTGCVKSDWFSPRSSPAAAVAVGSPGYWVARADGVVEAYDGASWHGDMGSSHLNAAVLGMTANPAGNGYWLVAADGGIFTFNTGFHGSTGGMRLNQPVVGMASTQTGGGYWLVARDGGIFSFGDAAFHGSTGAMRLNRPVVGMATTASGGGYWLVAADGGIFSFGDATFHGSTGAITLNRPIVGMARTPSGGGYWLVAADGGIFSFGDAGFHGSLGGQGVQAVGMAPSAGGAGYWIVTSSGVAHPFGDAR